MIFIVLCFSETSCENSVFRHSFSYLLFFFYILSSAANATLFFLSSFKSVNNLKTFCVRFHLKDPTTFLRDQIKVLSAHAKILISRYKNAFSVPHVCGLVILQNHAPIQNLEKSPGECMSTETSKFATQRQESPLIVFKGSTSLDDVVEVFADVARMFYFVSAS